MIKILASQYFLNFCVPLITVGISVFIKCITRNDQHSFFKKEELVLATV